VENGNSRVLTSPNPEIWEGSLSMMVISVGFCCAQALDAMQMATAAEMRVALKNGEWFAMTFP
jgi:hypothetical protein